MNGFYTDFQGLTALRAEARREAPSPETLRRVAGEFEALFLQRILQAMRAAHLAEGAFASDTERHYLEWFDAQLASRLAQGQGLGIARLLIERLQPKADTAKSDTPALPPPRGHGEALREANPAGQNGRITAQTQATDGLGRSPEDFVRTLWPHAQRAAQALGVAPQVLLAQAALETGWGKSVPRHPDGRSSHNVFAIKAGPDWRGGRIRVATLEYEDGIPVRRRAEFRAYGSYEEAFADYVRLLGGAPRYRAARGEGDPEAFARALEAGGYATDPAYARKITAIVHGETLGRALLALKFDDHRPLT